MIRVSLLLLTLLGTLSLPALGQSAAGNSSTGGPGSWLINKAYSGIAAPGKALKGLGSKLQGGMKKALSGTGKSGNNQSLPGSASPPAPSYWSSPANFSDPDPVYQQNWYSQPGSNAQMPFIQPSPSGLTGGMPPFYTRPTTGLMPLGGSSTSNLMGGYNIINPDGSMTVTTRNLMGGQNIMYPNGGFATTTPNLMGGFNMIGPNGGFTTSSRNVFGGQNIIGPDGQMTTTMPNLMGGQNIYSPSGSMTTTMPNLMGGFNTFP